MRRKLDLPDPFRVQIVTGSEPMDVLGSYAETYWLPHLGPSAYLAARRAVLTGEATWEKAVLAASLGIGVDVLEKSLARLESFGLATDLDGVLHVRRYWTRLPSRLLAKMPPALRAAEAELAAA